MYVTVLLAIGQSVLSEIGTTDDGHTIVSAYFLIEALIIMLVMVPGFKNRWARVIIAVLTVCEMVLFIQDRPVSPDELLMIVIFALRVYVVVGLFRKPMSQYYRTGSWR